MAKRPPPSGTALDLKDEFTQILRVIQDLRFNPGKDFPPGFEIPPYSVVITFEGSITFRPNIAQVFEKIAAFRKGAIVDIKAGNLLYITFSTREYTKREAAILSSNWLKFFRKIQRDSIVFKRKILGNDEMFLAMLDKYKII